MGFSFRRSTSFGPFRFNFSQFGVGGSFGIKGARVTRTAKGVTYITLGSNGVQYRQTIASASKQDRALPKQHFPQTENPEPISTVDVEQLVDSSSAALIGQLNQRATAVNPAIAFYALALLLVLWSIATLSSSVQLPSLPDDAALTDLSRRSNLADEYALMLARYGQPDRVVVSRYSRIPVRTAFYSQADIAISLVPNGCVDAYQSSSASDADADSPSLPIKRSKHAPGKKRVPSTQQAICNPVGIGSTIVGYRGVSDDSVISARAANQRMNTLESKTAGQPVIVFSTSPKLAISKSESNREIKGGIPRLAYSDEELQKQEAALNGAVLAHRTQTFQGRVAFFLSICSIVIGALIHRCNRRARTTTLVYETAAGASISQQPFEHALSVLAKSHAIWRIVAKSTTYNWKRNAGAAQLLDRTRGSVSASLPPRVVSNYHPRCLDLGKMKLYPMPDLVLIWQNGRFGSVAYSDLKFEQTATRFIEAEAVPHDARRVGTTWRFVRRDGAADRRFNNNRELPIVQYGAISLKSSQGLNLLLHASSYEATLDFVTCMKNTLQDDRAKPPGLFNAHDSSMQAALKLFNLELTPPIAHISEAYHRLAQMYHPDKVAGLAPEFREVAESKMKEVNAAYELLRRSCGGLS